MSPFQPVTTESPFKAWTLSMADLARCLPPELISTAAPPEEDVTLNLPASVEREDHLDVSLVQIYRNCPQLFTQPITHANDVRVKLPLPLREAPASGGGLKSGQPAGAASPFRPAPQYDEPSFNPFGSSQQTAGQGTTNPFLMGNAADDLDDDEPELETELMPTFTPQQNPAPQQESAKPWQPTPRQEAANPFLAAAAAPGPSSPGHDHSGDRPASPFGSAAPKSSEQTEGNPSQDLPIPDSSRRESSAPAAGKSRSQDGDHQLVFNLQSLLAGASVQSGGQSTQLSQEATVRIPLARIRPQLARGRVSVYISELIEAADDASQGALAHLDPNEEVPIPLKDIFHQLPADMLPEPESARSTRQAAQAANPFETPFSPQLDAMPADDELDSLPEVAAQAQPTFAVSSMSDAVFEQGKPEENVTQPSAAPSGSAPQPGSGDGSPFPSLRPRAGGGEPPTGPSSELPARQQEPPREEKPAQPSAPTPQPQAPAARNPAPAPAAPARTGAMLQGLHMDQPIEDLELKAIFGVSDSFNLKRVADMSARLAAVDGAVILSSDGRVLADCISQEQVPVNDLARRAASIYGHVRCLAEEIGFADGETFSLQTNRGVIHFFGNGERILVVVQREPGFGPGIREKLTLASRGMARLKN